MKTSKLLLLGILFLSLAACKKDEENNSSTLVGSWNVTGIDYSGTTTTVDPNVGTISGTFTGLGKNLSLEIHFSENPNDYTTSGTYDIDLTTMVQGQTYNTTWTSGDFIDDGTWELDGSTLRVTNGNGDVSEATIIEVNNSTLILEWMFSQVETNGSTVITSDVAGTYTFQRK